jgi:hypothetical protein
MTKIPIPEYNNHKFENLEYDTVLKVLFFKNKGLEWKTNKSVSLNKKTNEHKTYVYQTVVIPDAEGKKHKIFREKFESVFNSEHPEVIPAMTPKAAPAPAMREPATPSKQATTNTTTTTATTKSIAKSTTPVEPATQPATSSSSSSIDPCADVHEQLFFLQEQMRLEEEEEIRRYFETHSLDEGHIIEIGGRKRFIL